MMTRCDLTCHTPTPSQCHCPTCHRTFGGISGFDRHRRGGLCLDPGELGYAPVKGVWRQPMTEADIAARRGVAAPSGAIDLMAALRASVERARQDREARR